MIVVTGASGTIGSSTVAALKRRGAEFKLALRSPEKAQALGADAVAFDWDDLGSYERAFAGADKLFFLTPTTERAGGYALQLVAAAKRAGIKHIVRLSVVGADADPGIALGRQHRAIERELESSGIPWTFLRPTFFMQNAVNFWGIDPSKDGDVYQAYGTGKTANVDARDVGEVAATVLTSGGHEGKAYTLTGPEALGTHEALAILGEALGRKYRYVDVPPEAAAKAMSGMGWPAWLVDGFGELSWLIRQGYAAGVAPDVEQVLGRPPTSFRTFARDYAAQRR